MINLGRVSARPQLNSKMKKKINSKHIFDNLNDALKFTNTIEKAGFKRDECLDDGGVIFVNTDGHTMYVAVQSKIRY